MPNPIPSDTSWLMEKLRALTPQQRTKLAWAATGAFLFQAVNTYLILTDRWHLSLANHSLAVILGFASFLLPLLIANLARIARPGVMRTLALALTLPLSVLSVIILLWGGCGQVMHGLRFEPTLASLPLKNGASIEIHSNSDNPVPPYISEMVAEYHIPLCPGVVWEHSGILFDFDELGYWNPSLTPIDDRHVSLTSVAAGSTQGAYILYLAPLSNPFQDAPPLVTRLSGNAK